jgi:3'-phosphoadenosine 5'-phosphosulfate sulfotransferase (PAPS reductase)/FAD synthetase
MYLELKDKSGKLYRSFMNDRQKPVIIINDTEYEVSELIPNQDNSDALSTVQIAELDADPEIAEMIQQSKQDIEHNSIFSSKQMTEMIRNGEL